MAITNEDLKALKEKLDASSPVILNAVINAQDLEALKDEVVPLKFTVGEDTNVNLTAEEWEYLNVQQPTNTQKFNGNTILSYPLMNAIQKIDTCIKLTDDKLEIFGDLADFFSQKTEDLKKYAKAANQLTSENFAAIGDNFGAIVTKVINIQKGLENLKPAELVKIFNTAAGGKDNQGAKADFIAALKKMRTLVIFFLLMLSQVKMSSRKILMMLQENYLTLVQELLRKMNIRSSQQTL